MTKKDGRRVANPLTERVSFRCTADEKRVILAHVKNGVKLREIILKGIKE